MNIECLLEMLYVSCINEHISHVFAINIMTASFYCISLSCSMEVLIVNDLGIFEKCLTLHSRYFMHIAETR